MNSFQRHVDFTRKKSLTSVNILKTMNSRHLGARSRHLFLLASSAIRSSADYGAMILSSASVTIFKKLEAIDTSALRIDLGMPKWTPNEVLCFHATSIALHMQIWSLTRKFWIK